uniref:Uncharacterized protein n=1 Tax=Rhizophora mucronata TaxID=61149 RepID=A0A2P2P7F3_RHIMU
MVCEFLCNPFQLLIDFLVSRCFGL